MSTDVKIPASDLLHVAEVVTRLVAGGVPLRDLSIAVRDGEMELVDDTGSYGIRSWEARS